ncbi:MAG: hypothetical protein EXS36_12470 [Pedosphaera sp.]|nr:hypothetical protein [Pedosphaera sp.]
MNRRPVVADGSPRFLHSSERSGSQFMSIHRKTLLSMNQIVPAFTVALLLSCAGVALAADSSVGRPGGVRFVELKSGAGGKTGFTLMSPTTTGLAFSNVLKGDLFLTNVVAHNGSGLAIGDVDGDGRQDIYFCSLQGPNHLYRNLGNWKFEEMSLGDVACAGQLSTGATLADVDGDGDLDLLVNGIAAGTRLFLNGGKGNWTEMKNSGLSRTASATSMALADIDGDGDLDLYCAHYIDVLYLADPTTRLTMGTHDGRSAVVKVNGQTALLPPWKDRFEVLPDGNVRELAEVDGLYRNDGHGHFTPIQFEPGVFQDEDGKPVAPYRELGLGVMFRDINGDGAPDCFVCNDNASPNRFWINTGKGSFRALPTLAIRHASRSSMGIDFADIDRDGHDDFIVLDMLAREHGKRMTQLGKTYPDTMARDRIENRPMYNRNTLYFGRRDGSFVEAALMAGLAASDWSWCPVFMDVDLDGYEDLLITNGFEQDVLDQDSIDQIQQRKWTLEQMHRYRQIHPSWRTENAAFRNRGDGTFEPVQHAWRFDLPGVSHGMAVGDLDNDGDLDVVVNNLNEAAGVYRNDTTAPRVGVRLKGLPPNTQGIGARLQLHGGPVIQSQEMISGGRYMSSDQAMRVFAGGGNSTKPFRLEVQWRSGRHSTVTNVIPSRVYEVDEAEAAPARTISAEKDPTPYFSDVSRLLQHVHVEASVDEAMHTPRLPRRLNRMGPGMAWYDFNSDGWEDLIVTAGRGGKLSVLASEEGNKFSLLEGADREASDQSAVVGWSDGKGNQDMLIAISNLGLDGDAQSQLVHYSAIAAPQKLPAGRSSIGPLAVADVDGDGDLDVFVGGRVLPDRYPEPASSALWLNEHGELRVSTPMSEAFQSIGMVSGATFSDLDGNGTPDLVLALDWGPLRIFRNVQGHFEEMTIPWGFAPHTGLWSGVAVGDFDGDGRMDIVAGNWGRNTAFELYSPGKLGLIYGDWTGERGGSVQVLEAWRKGDDWMPISDRNRLAQVLPDLQQRFATHAQYGKATVPDILGTPFQKAKILEAVELESAVFMNRGSRFERIPLPREAQLAPVYSVNVGDFDGDGIEDLFLSQNFFGTATDLSRDDGGRGLWLRGSGRGTFVAVDSSISGIRIDGEQRAAALADFNHDGRIDLAVAQNREATKLYVNKGAKRGLRVVLVGAVGNPSAIGAQMRVLYGDGLAGPCRSIQAGSGYWSQDGSTQVLGLPHSPRALWIRWPGGHEQTVPIEQQTWELRVTYR